MEKEIKRFLNLMIDILASKVGHRVAYDTLLVIYYCFGQKSRVFSDDSSSWFALSSIV